MVLGTLILQVNLNDYIIVLTLCAFEIGNGSGQLYFWRLMLCLSIHSCCTTYTVMSQSNRNILPNTRKI